MPRNPRPPREIVFPVEDEIKKIKHVLDLSS